MALALLGAAIGSYYDLANNKNVPNFFLYGFLALAFIVNIAAFDPAVTWYGMAVGGLVFAATYVLYKTGKLGGADAFLLAGITLLLPVQPISLLIVEQPQYPSLPFAFYLFAASGASFMAYMLLRSFPIAFNALKTGGKIPQGAWMGAVGMLVAFAIFSYVASQNPVLPPAFIMLMSALVLVVIYFTLFQDAINLSMMEWVAPHDVEVEDVLAVEHMDKAQVSKLRLARLVDDAMHARLQKSGIKKVPVYKGLPPFIPHIFIGLALCLLFGNIMLLFMGQLAPF